MAGLPIEWLNQAEAERGGRATSLPGGRSGVRLVRIGTSVALTAVEIARNRFAIALLLVIPSRLVSVSEAVVVPLNARHESLIVCAVAACWRRFWR